MEPRLSTRLHSHAQMKLLWLASLNYKKIPHRLVLFQQKRLPLLRATS